MKVSIGCFKCMGPGPTDSMYTVPVGNTCIYELTCRFGHETVVVIQNSQFEVIFESGISALKDNYFREAVFNFSVALERFYEYSLLYMLRDKIISPITYRIDEAGLSHFQTLWATMSKQSERQVGAFYALYLNEFNQSAPVFNRTWLKENTKLELKMSGKSVDTIEFRNKVVHQGHIPTKEEAILYGECINRYVHSVLNNYLAKNGEQSLTNTMEIERQREARKYKGNRPMCWTGINTFIGSVQPTYLNRSASLYELFPEIG